MSVEEEPIWIEAGSPIVVPEVQLLHDRSRIPQNATRSLRVCEEVRRRICPSGWNRMEDAENQLSAEPALIGTNRLEDRNVNMPKSHISINMT